jgi:hypothetical protein
MVWIPRLSPRVRHCCNRSQPTSSGGASTAQGGIGTTIERYIGLDAQHKLQAVESLSAKFSLAQKQLQAGVLQAAGDS